MIKKKTYLAVLFSLFSFFSFSQELQKEESLPAFKSPDTEKVINNVSENQSSRKPAFSLHLPTSIYINTQEHNISPNAVLFFSPGVSLQFPRDSFFSVESTLGFFSMYYLWNGTMAVPAPIEHREASSLNFMFDVSGVFSFIFPHLKISLSVGPMILIRFAYPAFGVSESEGGYKENTVKDDIQKISDFFWSKGRFFYIKTGTSFLFKVSDKIQAGPFFDADFPIGSFISSADMNAAIFSAGLKVVF